MPQIDVVDQFACHKEEDEADKDPGDKDMGIVSILVHHVAKAQEVELALTTTTGCIDGEQDRPGYAAADKTDDDGHFEVAQQEVAIERVMLKNVLIGELRIATHQIHC